MGETVARAGVPVACYAVNGPPVTSLLLVRHGQSEWNAEGRWQGQADPPLSALGERQAVEATNRLDGVRAVWASDLVRAARTAELVAAELGVDVVLDTRWRERHAGEWQGHTRDEIEAAWPGYLEDGRRPPSWEADADVVARALDGCTTIAAAHPGEVVLVVTHGGVVRTLERHLDDPVDELLPNLGGRWVEVSGGTIRLGGRVVLLDGAIVTRPEEI
jgi:broad specificity phosphatase PhoE